MREEVKNWWEQAQADLKTARDNITNKNYYASVMFSQQAAEKSLKAVYILLKDKLPPRIHDLVELCRLVSAPEKTTLVSGKLTVTYLPSHYPGVAPVIPVKFYDQKKAEAHLNEAEEIVQWVKKQIK
ncbi:MAG: HEPN domain-containing protein [Nanoarchaeota archaeon]|nr:HEPN domain-containing protein [Nanoarchaeota archaeon]MBU1622411.1 HEPN domain-containing protein [Nanoarchaeota archaeon]